MKSQTNNNGNNDNYNKNNLPGLDIAHIIILLHIRILRNIACQKAEKWKKELNLFILVNHDLYFKIWNVSDELNQFIIKT